jgi:outer membrane protein TolC
MKQQDSLGSYFPGRITFMLACSLGTAHAVAVPSVTNERVTSPISSVPATAMASDSIVALDDEPLSLDDSIRLALRNHGDVIVARQQVSGATQRVQSARSARAPQVTGNINSNYQNGSVAGDGLGSGSFAVGDTATGIGVSQMLFDGGRTRERVRQANASALGTVGSLGSTRSSPRF